MSTLRASITELASHFAAGVLNAIKGASLEDILAETNRTGFSASAIAAASGGGARRGPGRPKGSGAKAVSAAAAEGGKKRGRRGRLGRRSADDIGAIVEKIVSLLAQSPKGLRAEEIRAKLGLEAKELPRPIADALAAKKISKQGEKRATTYFAKGGSGGGASAGKGGKPGKKAAKAGKTKAKKSGPKKGAKRGPKPGRKAAAAAASTEESAPAEAEAV